MQITVRYHALLREKTGVDAEYYNVGVASATVADVVHEFGRKHPGLQRLSDILNIAVNEEIVSRAAAVKDGDLVDLMPPFGGG